ncbi:MAG: O-antigen ligase family protein [Saprospiraceae bacterium]|nr:O-antigen ligase family protein [Saprospiraceae bacterium]
MLLNQIISVKDSIKNWLGNQIFIQKLNNPMGLLVFTTLGLVLGSLIPYLGLGTSTLVIGGIVVLPMIFACMFYHQFGVIFTLIVAFLVQYVGKITSAPIGTSLDGLLLLMIAGILVSQVMKKDWSFAKDPISSLLLFWIYFNIFQVLNPSQESKMAWLFTVRSLAILNLLYFIACYAFSSLKRIQQMLNVIVILATITAIYGLKQEFVGFSSAEKSWIYQDPERFQLFFQWGRMRTFSLFNDAMTFGIMMAYMGLFCLIYATAPMRTFFRGLLVFAAILMFWSSVYTGTRTCFALIPLGFAFYAFMTLKKEVFIGFAVFLAFGAVLVMKGGNSNAVLFRVRSAFEPSEDASVQIRYYNQKRIRPYIYSHPIGFGPGSTGLWARRFTPDSFLAKFAHDSYYVRLAVEEGWIGMGLYMFLLFTVLRRALYFYLRVRDPLIKTLYLSLLTSLFMLAVANYPQEAIVQLPTSLVSYVFFAAVVRLKDFDPFYQSIVAKAKINNVLSQ